jgi:hypothetical protein
MSDMAIETLSAFILNTMVYIYHRFGIFSFIETYDIIMKEKRRKFIKKVKKTIEQIKEKVDQDHL